MHGKKVIKPDLDKNLETNGSGDFGSGSGIAGKDTHKKRKKISKSLIIIISFILLFVLALIIL